jgi:hypothetical protein
MEVGQATISAVAPKKKKNIYIYIYIYIDVYVHIYITGVSDKNAVS